MVRFLEDVVLSLYSKACYRRLIPHFLKTSPNLTETHPDVERTFKREDL